MTNHPTTEDRLDGWEAIASYLGWHPRTVIRWEKLKGLPIHRIPGGKRQPVYAFRHEIDQWFHLTPGAAVAPHQARGRQSILAAQRSATSSRMRNWSLIIAVGATALLVFTFWLAGRFHALRKIQITGLRQLTDDGTSKLDLVADPKELYFTEETGGESVLSAMSLSGGPIRRIHLSLPNPHPKDLSPDGKLLLVGSYNDPTDEHALWVVPLAGGAPYRIEGALGEAAAWSPHGDWIAFGSGKAIYLIAKDGTRRRQLCQLDGFPIAIRWSSDAKRLIFVERLLPSGSTSLWQINLDHAPQPPTAVPSKLLGDQCCWTEFLARAASDFFLVRRDASGDQLLRLSPQSFNRPGMLEASNLGTHLEKVSGLAANERAQKLFVLSDSADRGELVRYDPMLHAFTLLLPGASATYVDYSKIGGLVAYVKLQEKTLWISKIDGGEGRRLTPLGMEVELPRWSPNGKEIAFTGKQLNRPWRVFIVPAAGGTPIEASDGDDNQGAPTWSPDGRYLVYGNVHCQEEHSCAVHRIDVRSREITMLPGSQGLSTARWSSDGRHIAALDSSRQELYVLDGGRKVWRKLAEGINGNDISWSSDSRFIYTKSSTSGHTEILRVAATGGPVQSVLTLDSFSRTAGKLDTWFSLAPDGSLLLNRWLNTSEIYELSYVER